MPVSTANVMTDANSGERDDGRAALSD